MTRVPVKSLLYDHFQKQTHEKLSAVQENAEGGDSAAYNGFMSPVSFRIKGLLCLIVDLR
jgi:hypothetical protein